MQCGDPPHLGKEAGAIVAGRPVALAARFGSSGPEEQGHTSRNGVVNAKSELRHAQQRRLQLLEREEACFEGNPPFHSRAQRVL